MNTEMNELREAAGLSYALNILGEFDEVIIGRTEAFRIFTSNWDKIYKHGRLPWWRLGLEPFTYMPPENISILTTASLMKEFNLNAKKLATSTLTNKQKKMRMTLAENTESFMLIIPNDMMNTGGEGWELETSGQPGHVSLPFGVTGTIVKVRGDFELTAQWHIIAATGGTPVIV